LKTGHRFGTPDDARRRLAKWSDREGGKGSGGDAWRRFEGRFAGKPAPASRFEDRFAGRSADLEPELRFWGSGVAFGD
jgi:hypothetical protein